MFIVTDFQSGGCKAAKEVEMGVNAGKAAKEVSNSPDAGSYLVKSLADAITKLVPRSVTRGLKVQLLPDCYEATA